MAAQAYHSDSDDDDLPVMRVSPPPAGNQPDTSVMSPATAHRTQRKSDSQSRTAGSPLPVTLNFDLSAIDHVEPESGPPSVRMHLDADDAELSRVERTPLYLQDRVDDRDGGFQRVRGNPLDRMANEPGVCSRRRWIYLVAGVFVTLLLAALAHHNNLVPLPFIPGPVGNSTFTGNGGEPD